MDEPQWAMVQYASTEIHHLNVSGEANVYLGISNISAPRPAPGSVEQAAQWLFGGPPRTAGARHSSWLDPHAGVVPVVPRPEAEQLAAWCAQGPGLMRLVCGPGGQGKTVLAEQLCAAMREQGWLAGLVALPPVGRAAAEQASARLRAAVAGAPALGVRGVLLVVDYADHHADLAATVFDAAADADRAGVPVRVLLLARRTGRWWTNLLAGRGGGLIDPYAHQLPPLFAPDPAEAGAVPARDLWQQAVDAFADRAVAAGLLPSAHRRAPDRLGPFTTTLDLYVDALTFVLDQAVGAARGADDPVGHLLRVHEYRQLALAVAEAVPGVDLGQYPTRVLDLVCLRPVEGSDEAAAVLALLPEFAGQPPGAVQALIGALARLYPGDGVWGAPRPDRLTDVHLLIRASEVYSDADWSRHLAAICAGGPAPVVVATLLRALSAPEAAGAHRDGARRLRAGLCALVKADPGGYLPELLHADHDEQFTAEIAAAVEDPATGADVIATLNVVLARMPVPRHRQVAVHVSRRAVADDASLAEVITLSRRLAEAGSREDALATAREAAGQVGGGTPVGLAASAYNNLAARLLEHHHAEQAVAAVAEAVRLRRELADADPARTPDLWAAQANQIACLIGAGRVGDAVDAARQAVDTMRAGTTDAGVYRLAAASGYLAEALRLAGRVPEAVAAAQEALELVEGLARDKPLAYRAAVAAARMRLAGCQALPAADGATVQQVDDGATAQHADGGGRAQHAHGGDTAQHAEDGGTAQHADGGDTAQPADHGGTVRHAVGGGTVGHVGGAVWLAEQAVAEFRRLVGFDADAYRADLAAALHTLAICHAHTAPEQGLAAVGEAITLLGQDAAELGACWSTRALLEIHAGRLDEAVDSATTAVARHEDATGPGSGRDLAAVLGNLAFALHSAGRHAEAADAAQRAVDLTRAAGHAPTGHDAAAQSDAAAQHCATAAEQADALANLALCCAYAGRVGDARQAQADAVRLYQAAGAAAAGRLPDAEAFLRQLQASTPPDAGQLRARFRRHWPLPSVRHLLPGIAIGYWATDLAAQQTRPRQLREELVAWFDRRQPADQPVPTGGLASLTDRLPLSIAALPYTAAASLDAATQNSPALAQVGRVVAAVAVVVVAAVTMASSQPPPQPPTATAPTAAPSGSSAVTSPSPPPPGSIPSAAPGTTPAPGGSATPTGPGTPVQPVAPGTPVWGFAAERYADDPIGQAYPLHATPEHNDNSQANWTYGLWRLGDPDPIPYPLGTHLSLGRHLITLPQVGTPGGVVHTLAFDFAQLGTTCQPVTWEPQGADENIVVVCFDKQGNLTDRPFRILFLGGSRGGHSLGGHRGYVLADRPATTAGYQPKHRDGVSTVRRTARGRYTVSTTGRPLSVQLTPVGQEQRFCAVTGRTSSSVNVSCTTRGGAAADTVFALSYTGQQSLLDDDRRPRAAYASVTDPGPPSTPQVTGWGSMGGDATVARLSGVGRYKVNVPGNGYSSYTHITAHGGGHCTMEAITDDPNAGPALFWVACYNAAGVAAHQGFDVTYMSATPHQ